MVSSLILFFSWYGASGLYFWTLFCRKNRTVSSRVVVYLRSYRLYVITNENYDQDYQVMVAQLVHQLLLGRFSVQGLWLFYRWVFFCCIFLILIVGIEYIYQGAKNQRNAVSSGPRGAHTTLFTRGICTVHKWAHMHCLDCSQVGLARTVHKWAPHDIVQYFCEIFFYPFQYKSAFCFF